MMRTDTKTFTDANTRQADIDESCALSDMEAFTVLDPIKAIPPNLSIGYSQYISGSESNPYAALIISREDKFLSLSNWAGVVLSVEDDTFWAHITTPNGIEEDAEFFVDDLSPDDRPLLSEGALFYFNLGYLTKRSGQRARASYIKFRRIPCWTSDEILDARNSAQSRMQRLHVCE